MARRSSYQNAKPEWRNDCWTVRYRELDHQTGVWKQRRKRLEGCNHKNNKKAAKSAADAFMAQVNERNNNLQKRQERLTFKVFIEGRWAAYKALGHADDSTTKAHYIHISQKSASRVLEAVANRILSHCDTTFIQESDAVN